MHEQREVVKLEFSYSEELVKLVKNLPGVRWNRFYRIWYIEKRAGLLYEILECFKGKAYLDYRNLKNEPLLSSPSVPANETPKFLQPVKRMHKRAVSKQYALFA